MHWIIPAAAALLLATPLTQAGDDKRLQQCQRLKDAIERYSDKRRAGGSPAQMERWRQARREKKNRWDELRCRDLGRKLK